MSETKPDLARLRIAESSRGRGRRLWPLAAWLVPLAVVAYLLRDRWLPQAGALLAPEVEVAAVELVGAEAAPPGSLTANGYVVAQRKADLAPKVAGKLEEILVVEGSAVEAGQVLARLERRDLDAQLSRAQAAVRQAEADLARATAEGEQVSAQIAEARQNTVAATQALREAEAALADARRELDRETALLEGGAGTRGDVDRAKAAFDQAEARARRSEALVASSGLRVPTLEAQQRGADAATAAAVARLDGDRAGVALLEAQIEYLTIRAPFAGVVIDKNAEVGEIVAPISGGAGAKVAVVTIVDMSSLMVEAEVSEAHIRRVRTGQPARITVDALPDERFPGKVFQVVPTANRQKATVQVKVAFDALDARIVPEMAARVFFLEGEEAPSAPRAPRLLIPRSALRPGDKVWIVENDRVSLRAVRTGPEQDGRVEILEGLGVGDVVVTGPSNGLAEGKSVRRSR